MDGWMHACMHGGDLVAWIDKIDHAYHRYISYIYRVSEREEIIK